MSVKQQPNLVSVDIGQTSLNMTFTTGNGVISKATSVKMQEGTVQNLRLRAPDILTAALLEAKTKGRINGKNCVFCIGGREVIIRYFKLPKMNDNNLYDNVVNEISSYLPFSANDYTIDFCVKDIIKDGDTVSYNVMAVAVHNDVVLPYIDAFRRAGLNIIRVDIKENAYEKLIKVLSEYSNLNADNYCIIDIGASTTTISTYLNGSFFINNTMSYGGNNFTNAVAKYYNIDVIQAEEKKIEICNSNYSEQDAGTINIMNAFFEKIVNEAIKVFEFYKKENNIAINEIFLCGGSSVVAGLAAYIESSTEIQTTDLRELVRHMFSAKIIEQKMIKPELFPAAIGATYREVD